MSRRVLALDTSTLTLSAALVSLEAEGPRVMAEHVEGPPSKQSDILPGVLEALLRSQSLSWSDLAGLVIGLGPGSFTGLRIGLATVKGLAYARQLPVAGVSSLKALAWDAPLGTHVLACAVARKGELYVGHFRRDADGVVKLAEEDVHTPESLAARVAGDSLARVLGPGIDEVRPAFERAGVADRLLEAPRFPSARALAALAHLPDTYDAPALFTLEPHYLRASEPERNPKFPPLPGPAPTSRLKD